MLVLLVLFVLLVENVKRKMCYLSWLITWFIYIYIDNVGNLSKEELFGLDFRQVNLCATDPTVRGECPWITRQLVLAGGVSCS